MKFDALISKLCRILGEQTGMTGQVEPDSDVYNKLGADSLDIVEIVMAIEEELCIELSDDEAESLGTTARSIANRLVALNKIAVDETDHERKLRTDPEYRAEFGFTTKAPGTIFTVAFESVNVEETRQLFEALLCSNLATTLAKGSISQPPLNKPLPKELLIAGCRVLRIDNQDTGKALEHLRKEISKLASTND